MNLNKVELQLEEKSKPAVLDYSEWLVELQDFFSNGNENVIFQTDLQDLLNSLSDDELNEFNGLFGLPEKTGSKAISWLIKSNIKFNKTNPQEPFDVSLTEDIQTVIKRANEVFANNTTEFRHAFIQKVVYEADSFLISFNQSSNEETTVQDTTIQQDVDENNGVDNYSLTNDTAQFVDAVNDNSEEKPIETESESATTQVLSNPLRKVIQSHCANNKRPTVRPTHIASEQKEDGKSKKANKNNKPVVELPQFKLPEEIPLAIKNDMVEVSLFKKGIRFFTPNTNKKSIHYIETFSFNIYKALVEHRSDLMTAKYKTEIANAEDLELLEERQLQQWVPNENIDLSELLAYWLDEEKIGVFHTDYVNTCSKGFKKQDLIANGGMPSVAKLKRKHLINCGQLELYKEITVNTSKSVTAMAFDIDMPYEEFEQKLRHLIADGYIPAPSFSIVRKSSRHCHVVWLLQERKWLNSASDKERYNIVFNTFNHLLDGDTGYHNLMIHNPFYQYLTDRNRYFSNDSEGYILQPPPIIDEQGQGAEPDLDKLVLRTFAFDDLLHISLRLKAAQEQQTMMEVLSEVTQDKNNRQDKSELSIFLSKDGAKNYDKLVEQCLDKKVFMTGDEYRNNTLFYNAMCMANINNLRSLQSIQNYVFTAYDENYGNDKAKNSKSDDISDSELRAIAKSVYQYTIGNRNYIRKFVDWHKSYDESMIDIYCSEQKRLGKLSGKVRQARQRHRQKQIKELMCKGHFAGLPREKLKEMLAIQFDVSVRTIERDLKHLEDEQAQHFYSFEIAKAQTKEIQLIRKREMIKQGREPIAVKRLTKTMWKEFLLRYKYRTYDSHIYSITELTNFIQLGIDGLNTALLPVYSIEERFQSQQRELEARAQLIDDSQIIPVEIAMGFDLEADLQEDRLEHFHIPPIPIDTSTAITH